MGGEVNAMQVLHAFLSAAVLGSVLAAQEPGAAPALPAEVPAVAERPPLKLGQGPWNSDIALLRPAEGGGFERLGAIAAHASEPSLARLDEERLVAAFQVFPLEKPEDLGRIAVAFSEDRGETWSAPLPILLQGVPEGYLDQARPREPCLVALDDGHLRLYFTAHPGQRTETGGFEPGGWPATYSAVSSDGTVWTLEDGRRFGIEGEAIVQPTVVRFRGRWHYFAPVEGRDGQAFHAESADGLAFQRLPEIELSGAGRWSGGAVAEPEFGEPDALLRFFGTGRVGWSAVSRDGLRWRLDGRTVWSEGADPSVVRLQDGTLLMAATVRGSARDEAAEAALREAMTGGPAVAMTANDRYLYVLRGETIYMYDAATLRFLRLKRLPPLATEGESSETEAGAPDEGGR